MAEKGSSSRFSLFQQVQIYHKIEKKDNEKCFKIPKTPSPRPALHLCLNQVRLNEISSNVQIKPNQISLDKKKKKNKKILSVSLTERTKSSDAFSILPSQEENSNYDNHFRNL